VVDKPGYNYACHILLQGLDILNLNDNDIVIFCSDDFYSPQNWDTYVINQLKNFNGCLFVRDGYQNPNVKEGMLSITMAIMTYGCIKKLNKTVFNPDYNHFFSDTELFFNLKELGLLKDNRDIDETTFEHKHYIRGLRSQDENDKKNYSFWEEDKVLFYKRMQMSVQDRLNIIVG
jgi:hypothetical protein